MGQGTGITDEHEGRESCLLLLVVCRRFMVIGRKSLARLHHGCKKQALTALHYCLAFGVNR